MNAFVKKEIRSLLPGWIVILFLEAVIPWFSSEPDTAFAVLPFFLFSGMVILSIDSFGREFSSGTFSLLLAQPMERKQIWRTKMAVLFFAVASIFVIYLISCWLRLHMAFVDSDPRRAHVIAISNRLPEIFWYAMFQSIIAALIAVTGALWTTLLLRQVATAFWIAFLTPAALAMTIIFFIPEKFPDAFEALFYIVAVLYSGFGFWLARKLFYRAQDAAWTGGVINFSRWRYFESGAKVLITRLRRPIRALFRKEFQLHSIALIGAGVLLGMHIAIFFLRAFYTNSHKNSTAAVISDFFWVLWLVMPLLIGCMAVAEERKLGVTDEQFCLPVSRRLQFLIKFLPTMFFGIFFGSIMPLLLETIAAHLGAPDEIFQWEHNEYSAQNLWLWFGRIFLFEFEIIALSVGFALAAFFASTLAKNFLQALSIAIVTIVGSIIFVGFIGWVSRTQQTIFGIMLWHSILPVLIALLVVPIALIWLAYLNFNHFQESKRLWRRNVLGISGALLFVIVSSAAIYNRAWEIFESAEPPHGAAKLSLQNPPKINAKGGITIVMPDGRAWLDYAGINSGDIVRRMFNPMPRNEGPAQFIEGSNWVQVVTDAGRTIGIKSDGTLWISPFTWNVFMPKMPIPPRFQLELTNATSENDWQAIDKRGYYSGSIYLLKTNHTLWEWSAMLEPYKGEPRPSMPVQVGTNFDWVETFIADDLLRKTDGTVWRIDWEGKTNKIVFDRQTNFDEVNFQTLSSDGNDEGMAYVGKDGRLMVFNRDWAEKLRVAQIFRPCGFETNWVSVAVQWHKMTALKSDGTLWQWQWNNSTTVSDMAYVRPTRLGIHNDWVAMAGTPWSTISLAADGGVWLWFDPENFYGETLMKSPKQPEFLGNVFGKEK